MMATPGTRLGSYELLALLGAGGMGEVYRARDLNLGREVAIKTVQSHLVHDPDHRQRFRREAFSLASLTHPHIATIYELDDVDGILFLAMELVEGETLEERLASGALPVQESLRLAVQICAALEAAHEKGIIHRDLKPSNVKITAEGTVKLLDFGLAKILGDKSAAGMLSQKPTNATSRGMLLGTVGYMSPEQARGKAIDRRADIWAFGCVLFRMLTGARAFHGDTVSDTIVSILERDPDWSGLPSATPATIRRLLERCMQKDLHGRLRDIGDARLELEEALGSAASASRSGSAAVGSAAVAERPASWRLSAVIGLIALAAAGGYVAGMAQRTAPPPHPVRQFAVQVPPPQRLAGLDFPSVVISPDGSQIAYVATRGGRPQLFIRPMKSLDASPLAGTTDAISPFFSSDGYWVAFFADGKLKKVPAVGGTVMTVCDAAIGFGGTWAPGDRIIFSPTTGSALMQVPAAGGVPVRVTTLDSRAGEFSHRWPELLPDGDTVLFTVGTLGSWDDAEIAAQSLSTGRRVSVMHGGTDPHYLHTGYLLYAHDGSLMAVPFDAHSLKISGQPSRVLENVMQSLDGAAQVAIAGSGDAVFVPAATSTAERRLLSVDRFGSSAALGAPPHAYSTPRVSPDGRRLLVTISDSSDDLWLYDNDSGSLQQITFDGDVVSPMWAADSRSVTLAWAKGGPPNLFSIQLGEQNREQRLASSEYRQIVGSWSPDGRTLAYVESRPTTGRDIWLLTRGGDRAPVPFIETTFEETAPRFSPDGRMIALVSNESGRSEVYVSRADDPRRAMKQLSTDGGTEPVWSRATHELIYRSGNRLVAVSQPANGDWSNVKSRTLFDRPFEKGNVDVANYDVSADGQHFIMVQATDRDNSPRELHVLLNWEDSLNGFSR